MQKPPAAELGQTVRRGLSAGEVIWRPIGFTLKGYAEVFNDDSVMRGFFNAIVITVSGVLINLAVVCHFIGIVFYLY